MLSQAHPRAHNGPHGRRIFVPRCWLMTDTRIAKDLPTIAARMPARSAIVIRSFALPQSGRASLIRQLRHIARARRHLLIWSGDKAPPGFDGRHGRARRADDKMLVMPVHNARESATAQRHRADAVLISPIHPTRSHPRAQTLGRCGFVKLAAAAQCPAIALGGIDAAQFRALRHYGAHGWAAIDGWIKYAEKRALPLNQKRNCVPT